MKPNDRVFLEGIQGLMHEHKLNTKTRMKILRIHHQLVACLVFLVFQGCQFLPRECEGKSGVSPQELLLVNDVVVLAEVVNIDTVAALGQAIVWSDTTKFYVIQYTVNPNIIFKGNGSSKHLYFWEWGSILGVNRPWSSFAKLQRGKSYLFYGLGASS